MGVCQIRVPRKADTKWQSCVSEKSQARTYVSEAGEDELLAHAGNVGSTHIGAIHEADAVHGADGDDEATVNAADNPALLLGREAMVVIVMAVAALVGGIDVAELRVILLLVHRGHGMGEGGVVGLRFPEGGERCLGLRAKGGLVDVDDGDGWVWRRGRRRGSYEPWRYGVRLQSGVTVGIA